MMPINCILDGVGQLETDTQIDRQTKRQRKIETDPARGCQQYVQPGRRHY